MSLINGFVIKSVSKNSDSFDDRICDDLCEVLLQYLPLEDKLRLEYVSKQFQRIVIQRLRRIYELNLNKFRRDSHFERHMYFINCLEQMAKKCPKLKRNQIIYQIFLENISDFEELMSSLKAFPHLKRLYHRLRFMSGLEFGEFFSWKCFWNEGPKHVDSFETWH